VSHALQRDGYKALVVSEPATELIQAGFIPESSSDYLFNEQVMRLHLRNLDVFSEIAARRSFDVIIYDRGVYDVRAYLSAREWGQLSADFDLCARSVIPRYYRHVVFLRTSALLGEGNVRADGTLEAVDDIIALDRATREAWEAETSFPLFDPREDKRVKYTEVHEYIGGLLTL
jgi:hypothetical protein